MTILLESTIRVTLIAAIIALVLFAMRIKTASVLHAVWAGVVVVMMLLPAWNVWGPKASLPILPPDRTPVIALLPPPSPAGLADATPHTSPVPNPAPSPARKGGGYVAIYLLGVGVFLLRLAVGTIRANRLTSASCVVPVTVGLLHPRIILPECSRDWPQAQLDAVLAHEGEHVRRRDPLFQWIALLNRAIFWFHPLAWWLERRLSGLAEEACDAAVIARGYDAREYSEYLLDLARSVERAGARIEAVGMAMPGFGLRHRIQQILSGAAVPRISRPRMACTAAVCAAAAAILAAGTLVRAQSPEPSFEVASVKPAAFPNPAYAAGFTAGAGDCGGGVLSTSGNRVKVSTASICALIRIAYDVKGYQILGMPSAPKSSWQAAIATAEKLPNFFYDIQADAGAKSVTTEQAQAMLRTLLSDRFQLRLHHEMREMPVYTLVIGRNKLKLLPSSADCRTHPSIEISVAACDWSMGKFADSLTRMTDRPVVDKTGLTGAYQFEMQRPGDDARGTPGPSLSTVVEDLGLKLVGEKLPFDVLVVDHVEKPSDN